jgi:hypothetical protein
LRRDANNKKTTFNDTQFVALYFKFKRNAIYKFKKLFPLELFSQTDLLQTVNFLVTISAARNDKYDSIEVPIGVSPCLGGFYNLKLSITPKTKTSVGLQNL